MQFGTTLKVNTAMDKFLHAINRSRVASRANLKNTSKLVYRTLEELEQAKPGEDLEGGGQAPILSAGTGEAADHQARLAQQQEIKAMAEKKENDGDDDESGSIVERFLEIIGTPLMLLFKVTVPDCREEKWESW